jgi:hypothetical protein
MEFQGKWGLRSPKKSARLSHTMQEMAEKPNEFREIS